MNLYYYFIFLYIPQYDILQKDSWCSDAKQTGPAEYAIGFLQKFLAFSRDFSGNLKVKQYHFRLRFLTFMIKYMYVSVSNRLCF